MKESLMNEKVKCYTTRHGKTGESSQINRVAG